MIWKLYYHGGATFSSEDGDWLDASAWGVMGVAYLNERYGYGRDTNDFYVFPPWAEMPWAADQWGVLDQLIQAEIITAEDRISDLAPQTLIDAGIKFGRSVDAAEWDEITKAMANDPELPHTSGTFTHERP